MLISDWSSYVCTSDLHRQSRGPAQIVAAVIAGEFDHPARMAGRELRDDRDRLILHGVALPVIHHGAQAIAAAHVALVHHAALRLPYGLARVEVRSLLRRTAWVGIELRAGQAQRVLRDQEIGRAHV